MGPSLGVGNLAPTELDDRKREVKRCTVATPALHPDAPAMRIDDALGDEQPQAAPRLSWRLVFPEPIEDVRQVFASDPGPRVEDPKTHICALSIDREGHVTAGGRELQGVSEEVGKHLKHALAVRADRKPRRL